MKKITKIVLVLLVIIMVTGCQLKQSDAVKFKKEYESLNGTKSSSNKTIRTISIDKENPMVYSTADAIVEKMENNETFVVYFGFASCPWCRSMLESFLQSAKDNNIKKIYYVDVYDIRDKYEVNKEGKLEKTEEGTDGYNELINLLGNVLDDYNITTESGETLSTNEKRIYAPNVVAVVNGKAVEMVEGISSKLEDPYSELTEEMKEESYNSFKCLWDCLSKESTICTKNAC